MSSGKTLFPTIVAALLLVPVALAPVSAQGGEDGLAVNGDWAIPSERAAAKKLAKLYGNLTLDKGRYAGAGLAFETGTCGEDGACLVNLSAGKSAATAIAHLAIAGGAALDVRSATVALASPNGRVLLAAAPPGLGSVVAAKPLTLKLRVADKGSAEALGPGALAIAGEGPAILLRAPSATAMTVEGRDVVVDLPAGGRAAFYGSFEDGLGPIPAANATLLVREGRIGGFLAGVRVAGAPHAVAVGLSGDFDAITLTPGALRATVSPRSDPASLYVFRLAPDFVTEIPAVATPQYAVLVDGRLAAPVVKATSLWNGTRPLPGTAFVSAKTNEILVAVASDGPHEIAILQAPAESVNDKKRAGFPDIRPGGKPANVGVGGFNATTSTGARLDGRYLGASLALAGADGVLTDVAYPGKATPLFDEVRVAGANRGFAFDASPNPEYAPSVARIAGDGVDVAFYDSPSAWTLVSAKAAATIALDPADGVAITLGTNEVVATLGDFHAHLVPWPKSPDDAAARPLRATLDAATGSVVLRLDVGDRVVLAAHPDAGGNVAEFHNVLDLVKGGRMIGFREATFDEDLRETHHFVGFGTPPRFDAYADGLARIEITPESVAGGVVVLDLTPEFARPYDPASYRLTLEGTPVRLTVPRDASGKEAEVFKLANLRGKTSGGAPDPGVFTATPDAIRAVVLLTSGVPVTFTASQVAKVPPPDPGRTFLLLLIALVVLASVVAWYVRTRWNSLRS